MRITWELSRAFHFRLRPCQRSGGGAGWEGSPRSQRVHVVVIELLRPEEPREGLALDLPLLGVEAWRMEGGVEGVGLGGAERHHRGEVAEGVVVRLGAEADRHRERGPGGQHGVGVAGELAAPLRGYGAGVAVDHGLVDPVLHVGLRIGRAEEPLAVGLVLGEEKLDGVAAGARVPPALADQVVRRVGRAGPDALGSPAARRPAATTTCCGTRDGAGHGSARAGDRD